MSGAGRGMARRQKRPRRKKAKKPSDLKAQADRMKTAGLDYLEDQLEIYLAGEGNAPEVISILKALKDLGYKHDPAESQPEPSGARDEFLADIRRMEAQAQGG